MRCSRCKYFAELKSCRIKLASDVKWAMTPNIVSVRSDLILIFHQDSVPPKSLSDFLDYTHTRLYGSPLFVLHPKNMKGDISSLNQNPGDSFKESKSCLPSTVGEFSGHFHGGSRIVQETFHCKASECYKRMVSEFERGSNYGKKTRWRMISLHPEEHNRDLKLRSPLQRTEPLRLRQTIYGFLVEDLDSNLTGKFYGYNYPKIYLDIAGFAEGDYLFPDDYQEFPVSFT
ncbi:unnamed protein product, partial [Allacma fusca]